MKRSDWKAAAVILAVLALITMAHSANAQVGDREADAQVANQQVGTAQPMAAQAQANLVTIVVTGEGMDQKSAEADAKRKAVEQAAGAKMYSQSQTRDFELIKDTILARAAGYVHNFEVISAGPTPDGAVRVQARVTVSKQGIEDTWGVVKNFLSDMGHPKVMVLINEKADQVEGTVQVDESAGQRSSKEMLQDESTVQTRIENLLLNSGFELVNKDQIEQIDQKDLDAAKADNDPAKAQAIAKKFHAQIFIKGTAHAATGLPKTIGGVLFYTYEGQANIKCYRTDTAQLMSSVNQDTPAPRGVQRVWRSAADQALSVLGDQMAVKVQNDILRFWLDATTLGGEVKLEVSGVSFKESMDIKKILGSIKGVSDVNRDFANQIATYTFQTTAPAEKMAEQITDMGIKVGDKRLDVSDLTANVIKAKLMP